jgi:anti-sigma regulatory factor (Ser/Thr protein kinase)
MQFVLSIRMQKESKSFISKKENLPKIILWITNYLNNTSLTDKKIKKIQLACEEIITNIIKHAYLEKENIFDISILIENKQVNILFKDNGPFFNPLQYVGVIDRSVKIEKRKEGGLGLFLIKKNVSDISYQRKGNSNFLTISIILD